MKNEECIRAPPEEGGIGKSIPDAQDFLRPSRFPSCLGVQNPWPREILGVGDGFSNPSLLLVEHGYIASLGAWVRSDICPPSAHQHQQYQPQLEKVFLPSGSGFLKQNCPNIEEEFS